MIEIFLYYTLGVILAWLITGLMNYFCEDGDTMSAVYCLFSWAFIVFWVVMISVILIGNSIYKLFKMIKLPRHFFSRPEYFIEKLIDVIKGKKPEN